MSPDWPFGTTSHHSAPWSVASPLKVRLTGRPEDDLRWPARLRGRQRIYVDRGVIGAQAAGYPGRAARVAGEDPTAASGSSSASEPELTRGEEPGSRHPELDQWIPPRSNKGGNDGCATAG